MKHDFQLIQFWV